ncbi:hypothetical protein V3C10_14260 [[Clostridium] symbiosum]|uniref:hypothetical protein n=1 Tax=Clostridium symbiosum TaxID=1512 RepID=UPI001D08B697|nr:hypothetical protein [[Clostridium] symbiosum]MCB6608250.1 hypothetical protein [[Clostridium] symbiosum]MCB6932800.1 hypothetical protein [[Clostridium] symbiosum]
MKRKWHQFKNNILYYLSAADVVVTGFVFHIIHIVTKRKKPTMMSEEMLEELERLVEEDRQSRKKNAPAGESEPKG